MSMDKETVSNMLDGLALLKTWDSDRAGLVMAVADASPESLRGIVVGLVVVTKTLAAKPEDLTATQFLDRLEQELQRELDKEPGQ